MAFDPLTLNVSYLSLSLLYLGYIDEARSRRDEALSRSRCLAHASSLALTLFFALMGGLHTQLAPALILPQAEELGALGAEHGFPLYEAIGAAVRGWCLSMLGRTQEGLALQIKAMATCRAAGALLASSMYLAMLAESYGAAGDPDAGMLQLDEAKRHMDATRERWCEADVHRVRGRLLVAGGDLTAAEASFQQAIAIARRQNAKLWELRTATSLACLWRDQGKRTEAHDLLAPIYGWFTEGFETPVLQDAKALLDQLA